MPKQATGNAERPDLPFLLAAVHLVKSEAIGLIVGFGRFRPWLEALAVALAEADDAAARWVAENGGLRLELVGQEIAVGRWSNASTFIGYLDHRYAPYVLAAMDVLVVPSILEEAFGMVAAEGAASGALPLVARHSPDLASCMKAARLRLTPAEVWQWRSRQEL